MIPPVLLSIADEIGKGDRVHVSGEWERDETGRWHLPVIVRLSVAPTEHMPLDTRWRLVIGPNQPDDGVFYYPDADGGLTATFRHQDANPDPATNARWRYGKPCLERPIGGLGRDQWEDEPQEIQSAALWKTGRLLQWVDAAASDSLATIGTANELPAGLGQESSSTLGFNETAEARGWADVSQSRWGFASLVALPAAKSSWALAELFDERCVSVRRFEWGKALREATATVNAVWILAPSLPVHPPWRKPATWSELNHLLAQQGIDLARIMVSAGARYRSGSRPTASHRLLIGFPYASRVGFEPERLHWIAVAKMPLAGRTEKRDGFRGREESRRLWDRQLAHSNAPLSWIRTENWALDQLRSRGGAEKLVRESNILVIGAGSLGSAVAENLCRLGALRLGIMDGETLTVGNLVRHTLGMMDVGLNKADALARDLNFLSPHADIRSIPFRFDQRNVKAAISVADHVRAYDVIVDCTGSDDVLDELAAFDWGEEKVFVSLSMTWEAEGLLAFCARESRLPAVDAKHRFRAAGPPVVRHEDAMVEAIGCWHPVFPADADDVQQWAAHGTKFVRAAVLNPERRCTYYKRSKQGGTEIIDVRPA